MNQEPLPDATPANPLAPMAEGGVDRRVEMAMSEDFVERAVVPFLRSPQSPLEVYEASVVRDIGTGRVTIRYDFGEGRVAYGKLYADEAGYNTFKVLGRLWASDFGGGSTYRVCQPLVYLPKDHFLLTRGVTGSPITPLVEAADPSLPSACRDAARWLVRLHSQRVHPSERQPLWDALRMTHNVRRLIKAAAAVPEAQDALTGMLKAVWTRGGDPQEPVGPVLTHGRFHHDHVFLQPGLVSVIDFDGCLPSDPARDLAEFLTVMRGRRFKMAGEVESLDQATRAFLNEYLSALPWNGANLSLYWGAFVLENTLKLVKRAKGDAKAVERTMEHLSRELFDILNAKFVPQELRL